MSEELRHGYRVGAWWLGAPPELIDEQPAQEPETSQPSEEEDDTDGSN